MEVFITAVKDLIKYRIISGVNTGDKTLDSLSSAIFISIATGLLTYAVWFNVYFRALICINKCRKKSTVVDKTNYLFHKSALENTKLIYGSYFESANFNY